MTHYYKILVDGRSCSGGKLTWSLPKNGKPGDWHEVAGELVRCRNGLHLTSEPTYRRMPRSACYLAEYEGETIGPFENEELVVRRCRLLRRVPWPELAIDDQHPDGESDSPAITLLKHVYKHEGAGMGGSWRRLNSAMKDAFKLAITCGMRFDVGDVGDMAGMFAAHHWWGDLEWAYGEAINGSHGPNPSAYQSIEKHKGRKPWIVMERPGQPKIRLSVGAQFFWFEPISADDPAKAVAHRVWVTSFDDANDRVVACSYEDDDRYSGKVKRRFAITREQVAEYHKIARRATGRRKGESVAAE